MDLRLSWIVWSLIIPETNKTNISDKHGHNTTDIYYIKTEQNKTKKKEVHTFGDVWREPPWCRGWAKAGFSPDLVYMTLSGCSHSFLENKYNSWFLSFLTKNNQLSQKESWIIHWVHEAMKHLIKNHTKSNNCQSKYTVHH